MSSLMALSCKKIFKNDKEKEVLEKLYPDYSEGEILRCSANGKNYYEASLNVFDAPYIIYDENGNKLGECNYFANQLHSLCKELKSCQTLYRCKNHINGQPAINVYNLP